jgi:hypothetical protein
VFNSRLFANLFANFEERAIVNQKKLELCQ